MEEQLNPKLLARYLAGETTPEESRLVQESISRTPGLRHELLGLAGEEDQLPRAVEEGLTRLMETTSTNTPSAASPSELSGFKAGDRPSIPGSSGVTRRRVLWTVLTLSLGAAFAVIFFLSRSPALPDVLEYATAAGERTTVRLEDGTMVDLSVATRLRVAGDFGETERRVQLTGEAFFDVASNPAKPFIIAARDAEVSVLGTEFTVRTYDALESVRVVVAEGRVGLAGNGSSSAGRAILTAGTMGRMETDSVGSAVVTVQAIDVQEMFAWRDGRLIFEGSKMEQVGRDLERWYGVPVRLLGDDISELRLDATFEGEDLEDVLQVIAVALGLELRSREGAFVLSSGPRTVSPSNNPTHNSEK